MGEFEDAKEESADYCWHRQREIFLQKIVRSPGKVAVME